MKWIIFCLFSVTICGCQSDQYQVNTACRGSFAPAAGWQATAQELSQ